jgi:hypothetical protein
MRLINVDDIKWQKGVFVNPMTDEPIPVIHKIATIEMLRDWQEGVKAIPLDKIKEARAEIEKKIHEYSGSGNEVTQAYCDGFKEDLAILDKLIAESEG